MTPSTLYLDDVGWLALRNLKDAYDDVPLLVDQLNHAVEYAVVLDAYDVFLQHFTFLIHHQEDIRPYARFVLAWPFPENADDLMSLLHAYDIGSPV